ncbi:MAG: hypothetical protein NT062_30785 [Proteobacteria bacterium]|nr:hypothetical protein [Pseudomonadota bacterium]
MAWVQDTETSVLGKPEVAMTYHPESVEIFLPDDVGPLSPVTEPAPTTPGVAKPVSPTQDVTPSNNQHVANQIPDRAKLHDDAIRDAIAMANLLVNPNDQPGGAPGTMDPRRPDSDLSQQIRDLRDTRVEIGTPSRVREDGKIRIGTTDRVIVDSPPTTIEDVAHRPEDRPVRIVVSPVRPDEDNTTLTPDTIMAKIGGLYLTGLQRCYQKGLAGDASLTGKVALRFTVNESGRVVDASAGGVSAGVDGCIASLMGGWTFAVPRDPKSKDPTEASFGLALQLTH